MSKKLYLIKPTSTDKPRVSTVMVEANGPASALTAWATSVAEAVQLTAADAIKHHKAGIEQLEVSESTDTEAA